MFYDVGVFKLPATIEVVKIICMCWMRNLYMSQKEEDYITQTRHVMINVSLKTICVPLS